MVRLLVPNANLHTCLFLNPFIGIKSLWPDNLAGKVQKWGFILTFWKKNLLLGHVFTGTVNCKQLNSEKLNFLM